MRTSVMSFVLCLSGCLRADFFELKRDGVSKGLVFTYLANEKRDSLKYYGEAAFELPYFLEYARSKKLPVVVVVPEKLDGRSPLDKEAPLYEGARVALAWSSAYFRFKKLGNVDVRILLVDTLQPDKYLLNKIEVLLNRSCSGEQNLTPEQQIEKRCPKNQFHDLRSSMLFSVAECSMLKRGDEGDENTRRSFGEGRVVALANSADTTALKPLSATFSSSLVSFNINKLISVERKTVISPSLPALIGNQKRFIVTGGAGFIGTHLVERLLSGGDQVVVIDNGLCCDSRNFDRLAKYKNCFISRCDATKPFTVSGPVSWVIHLASVPSPLFYYSLPVETLKTGLNGTKNTVDLALEKGAKYFFSSTSEVYGDPEVHPQPESYVGKVNPIGKRSQYDQSKRGAETLIKLYVDKYKLDARMSRIFNTYGPYMRLHDGRVVTSFIESILKNKPLVIYGDGKQTRSFAYVDDTVDGICKIIEHEFSQDALLEDRVFNVGNQTEMTVNHLARLVQEIVYPLYNKKILINYVTQIDPTDPTRRCPNLCRFRSSLGSSINTNLADGLKKTINYFLSNS